MATKLEKNLTRESTVEFNDRAIMITLTNDQRVSMKLKGLKSGEVSIGIDELYGDVAGVDVNAAPAKGPVTISKDQPVKGSKKNPMISLYDLRSHNAISNMDYPDKVKFERIILSVLEDM